ncbi:hypothetical protein KY329_03135 [Candidatus Woesearchaeota archaeon]|nr:hypothetical protein [Candidatus Woesearchaeota archaeon]
MTDLRSLMERCAAVDVLPPASAECAGQTELREFNQKIEFISAFLESIDNPCQETAAAFEKTRFPILSYEARVRFVGRILKLGITTTPEKVIRAELDYEQGWFSECCGWDRTYALRHLQYGNDSDCEEAKRILTAVRNLEPAVKHAHIEGGSDLLSERYYKGLKYALAEVDLPSAIKNLPQQCQKILRKMKYDPRKHADKRMEALKCKPRKGIIQALDAIADLDPNSRVSALASRKSAEYRVKLPPKYFS